MLSIIKNDYYQDISAVFICSKYSKVKLYIFVMFWQEIVDIYV